MTLEEFKEFRVKKAFEYARTLNQKKKFLGFDLSDKNAENNPELIEFKKQITKLYQNETQDNFNLLSLDDKIAYYKITPWPETIIRYFEPHEITALRIMK